MSNYLSRLKSDLRVAPLMVPYNLRVVKARDLKHLIKNFERLEGELENEPKTRAVELRHQCFCNRSFM